MDSPNPDDKGVIITTVVPASVADRAGTIIEGDILLAINGAVINNSRQAKELISRCKESVRLEIKKYDQEAEDLTRHDVVNFDVTLPRRYNQNLGFTISGKKNLLDKIIVTHIAEGGIAAKIGAIRVGDEISSINGVSLRTKKLETAKHLLRNSRDTVNLKIRREEKPTRRICDDSALESWDGTENGSHGKCLWYFL